MRRTISETAAERKLKMYLPAKNLQTPANSEKIPCFKQTCRRDTFQQCDEVLRDSKQTHGNRLWMFGQVISG
jgi:hypothetical protein